jgi:hypothetical protein
MKRELRAHESAKGTHVSECSRLTVAINKCFIHVSCFAGYSPLSTLIHACQYDITTLIHARERACIREKNEPVRFEL